MKLDEGQSALIIGLLTQEVTRKDRQARDLRRELEKTKNERDSAREANRGAINSLIVIPEDSLTLSSFVE